MPRTACDVGYVWCREATTDGCKRRHRRCPRGRSMSRPLPEDALLREFWNRCAIAVGMNDGQAALELCRAMHAVEGKIFLTIVPGARDIARKIETAGFRGRPIVSKYAGVCKVCGKPYSAGDDVLWAQGSGCAHHQCGEIDS